ncbi:MAG: ribbon-helix-helix domain-containing protein [Terriglobales bacterium]
MSDTITVRLSSELKERLKATARRAGIPVNRLVRDGIEDLVKGDTSKPWMKYAGILKNGPRNLSSRKGFSKK